MEDAQTSDVSLSSKLFGISFESKGSFVIYVIFLLAHVIKFQRDRQTLGITLSGKFHLVSYQSVTIHCKIIIVSWDARSIPKPYVFLLYRIIEVFKRKGENPRINILIDLISNGSRAVTPKFSSDHTKRTL